jgi:hypothetical protein
MNAKRIGIGVLTVLILAGAGYGWWCYSSYQAWLKEAHERAVNWGEIKAPTIESAAKERAKFMKWQIDLDQAVEAGEWVQALEIVERFKSTEATPVADVGMIENKAHTIQAKNRLEELQAEFDEAKKSAQAEASESVSRRLRRFAAEAGNAADRDYLAERFSKLEQDFTELLNDVNRNRAAALERAFRTARSNNLEATDVDVRIRRVTTTRRWVIDRYSGRYHYREADKDKRWVVIDFVASSDEKDPELPTFAAYAIHEGYASVKGTATIEFYRWSDYGAYLGNYHDNRNDFAKRDEVWFTAGIPIDEEDAQKPLYIGMFDGQCFKREYDRFEQPPVSYKRNLGGDSGCTSPDLEIDELLEETEPVQVLNRYELSISSNAF